jgi:hypothetical protein
LGCAFACTYNSTWSDRPKSLGIPNSSDVKYVEVWLFEGPFDLPIVGGKFVPTTNWKEIRKYFDKNAFTRHHPIPSDRVGAIRIIRKDGTAVTFTYYSAGKEGLVFTADGENFFVAPCDSGECSYKLARLIVTILKQEAEAQSEMKRDRESK